MLYIDTTRRSLVPSYFFLLSYLAATLFEATFARAAFPCFDEPEMKAKFSVTIIREGKYSSLSNMPLMQTVRIKRCVNPFSPNVLILIILTVSHTISMMFSKNSHNLSG